MGKNLFNEIRFFTKGDFSQEEVIENDTITGKKLPTSYSIFISDSDQSILLEVWNETEMAHYVFIKTNNKVLQNSALHFCQDKNDAHTLHKIDLKKGDELFASASEDNAISYNIII